ncbi:MAG: hypothetical protein O2780_14330 [Proteobacteria bacterium]|jgi:hypothetical protein|nr:hypothetical protein [Pseudomonadota bacterium]MDA1300779.1 hypothetical protein [Pseudomonadota bacterium]
MIQKLLMVAVLGMALSLMVSPAVANHHEKSEQEMKMDAKAEKKAAKEMAKAEKKKAKEMAKADKDENKQICKRVKDTGTYSGRRVCHTQKEWDVILGER